MTSQSSESATLSHITWDPVSLFSIINTATGSPTCVGFAASLRPKRRCQRAVSADNCMKAKELLNLLAHRNPSRAAQSDLEALARLCLCTKDHLNKPGEKDRVVEKWRADLENDINRIAGIQQAQEAAGPQIPRMRSLSTEERIERAMGSIEHVTELVEQLCRSFEFAQRVASSLQPSTITIPPTSEEGLANSQAPSTSNSVTVTITTTSIAPTRPNISSIVDVTPPESASPPASPILSSAPVLSSAGSASETPETSNATPTSLDEDFSTFFERTRSCTLQHANRRSIDEECVICTDLCTNTPLSELVWCKICGNNLHSVCFQQWVETNSGYSSIARCVVCRSDWPDPCHHDEQEPAFEIWSQKEIGLDMLFHAEDEYGNGLELLAREISAEDSDAWSPL